MLATNTLPNEAKKIDTKNETLIISLGLLHELNHLLTGAAFIRLAQIPGRLDAGAQLDPAQLNKVMSQILAIDAKFQAGKCDIKQFRTEVLAILKLKASDEEFDSAWIAMQGDVTQLKLSLEEIKKENSNIVLISKTNPIHIKHIYQSMQPELKLEAKNASNPLSLLGLPLHVSYQSPEYQETSSEYALYNEVLKSQNLDAKQVTIILQCESDSPYPLVKKRDEEHAKQKKLWAESQGMHVIDRKPKEKIADAIARDKRERNSMKTSEKSSQKDTESAVLMTGFGSKLHSGTSRLWSSTESVNTSTLDDETLPRLYRP